MNRRAIVSGLLKRRAPLLAASILVFIVAGTAVAGSGRGAAFNLGVLNTVNGYVTRLAGAHSRILQITNNSTATNSVVVTIKTLSGLPLQLIGPTNRPPFTTNSSVRVANLNADRVDGRSFACPAGTLFHEGVCIETGKRAEKLFNQATSDCLDEDRRLPTVEELQTFLNRTGHDFTTPELSNFYYVADGGWTYVTVGPDFDGQASYNSGAAVAFSYRCVVPAS